ncbi:beta-glucoside-specific PTS transporter subunit IIABC [Sporolactobacillus inulinus]|uniref:PTS beta-glucoside transporter subunit IIABC n=1 Tax=Sporolactobacillus inulinus CASD TaxID=1069536 RepID=A0A0U1QL58_9BACL|nr:beta-glucoside-specific PTS transporter subunit IIABC [Sporolactobacillus inulinus]KLI01356.1 PTS beta-glucoside transporter subunit IIABC [Sporolactobacillus inulinus CASD]GEB78243.1 PTS beta-glucoside transporter subunit EIIBCA [Sporolactobacillus inulinus]
MAKKDYSQLADEIVANVGGKENVKSLIHCATRLRFRLNDQSKANKEVLEDLPMVLTAVSAGGQYQVVIGDEVVPVYEAIMNRYGFSATDSKAAAGQEEKTEEAKSENWFERFVAVISGIFTPFISVLAGVGVLKGVAILISTFHWLPANSPIYLIINTLASGVFTLLPIFIAITAADKFNTNRYIAVALAAAMIYPLTDAQIPEVAHLWGYAVDFKTYGGAVIPTILAIWLESHIERWFKKRLPAVMQLVFVPFLTLIVAGLLTFLIIGPLGTAIGTGLAYGYKFLYDLSPLIAGGILGATFQIFVIFGLHWGILPISLINIQAYGYDTLLAVMMVAVSGQFGAVTGSIFRAKKLKNREIAISAAISGFFGITEPAIYGINLKYKKAFIFGLVGGALGGATVSAAGVKCFSYTPVMNIFEMPLFIGNNSSIVWAIIGFVVAFLSALLLVLIFGFNESNTEKLFAKVTSGKKSLTEKKTAKLGLNVKDEAAASTATEEAEHPAVNVSDLNLAETVYSPVAGNPVPLSQVDDPVFSSGAMGSGVGVLPSEGTCVSPVDGEITVAFPTGHAYGIKSDNGVEVLIHIGINTVELKGKHFDPKIETGAKVKKGDLLTTFEPDKIKEAGYDPTTMVIVTNTNNYEAVVPELDQDAAMNQPLIQVYSK